MEIVFGLVGALIGAGAAIGGQFIQTRGTRRIDEKKHLRTDIATATRSLLELLQAQQWIAFKLDHTPSVVSVKDFDEYDERANPGLSTLLGDMGVLSATWPVAYARYRTLFARVLEFDALLANAATRRREDPNGYISDWFTRSQYHEIIRYHWYVLDQVANVVEGEPLADYDAEEWEASTQTSLN